MTKYIIQKEERGEKWIDKIIEKITINEKTVRNLCILKKLNSNFHTIFIPEGGHKECQ